MNNNCDINTEAGCVIHRKSHVIYLTKVDKRLQFGGIIMEGMNTRQKKLIRLLVQNDEYLAISFYATRLSKSNRTIYSDLEKIQEELTKLPIKVSIDRRPRSGIKLLGSVTEKMSLLEILDEDVHESIYLEPVERQFEISRMLLVDGKTVTHQKLADKFHVSSSSISNDLEKVDESYPVTVVSSKRGTYIEGSEEEIQRSLFRFCENYLNIKGFGSEQLLDTNGQEFLSGLFSVQIVEAVFHEIDRIERFSDYTIPGQYRKSIIISLIVFFFRLGLGKHILSKKEFLFDQIQSLDTYFLANEIMEAISKKIQVDFDDQDLSYINRQLVGYGIKLETSTEQTYKKYEPIINKIIRNMSEIMHVDFSKDTALKEHFSQHFIPMIYRLKMGIETTNPLLAEIKSQYAIIFSSTWYAMGNVESELGVHFNDDEVAFLAMYFQVSLEKSQHGKKILIVCPTGVGTSELIYSRIKRVLPAQDTAEVTTIQNLYQSDLDSVDLIISSVNLDKIEKPIIKVSPLITQEDIKNISILYSDFFFNEESKATKPKAETFPFLKKVIDREYIFTNQFFENKDSCLDYMIDILKKNNIVSTEFRNEVFEREKLGETALDTGVAIPHAAPQNVLKSKVFILTLNRGIVWDNKRVNYILLICISKDEKKLVKGVITDIHKLVKSKENVKFFFNKTRPEEIYRKILGG